MIQEKMLVSGCVGETAGFNTQLLYFTCSSLTEDDRYLFLITDRTGSPNVAVRDLRTGEERVLTDNRNGIMKSYVYFDGQPGRDSVRRACRLTRGAALRTTFRTTRSAAWILREEAGC